MTIKKTVLWGFAAALVFSTLGFSGSITREFNKTYDFQGDEVSVRTVNGKIFIESWRNDAVEVNAEIKVRASSKNLARDYLENIEIVVRERGDALIIKVEQPRERGGGFMDWVFSGGKPNVTVNFWIKTPEEVDIEASSVNGSVEAVGIVGYTSIHTTNGKVIAEEIEGPVQASTTNGSIFVDIQTNDIDDDIDLHTVNGSIKLIVDQDIEADVDISTVNGSISTDFPLEVTGKWGPKKVRGEINGGGPLIKLETVNGSISIRAD
jgi:DUF4097 and DUF4098 domain-containing protein YvlB